MLFGWEITQMKIVIICFLDNYTYATPDVDATVAASLLILHNNVHIMQMLVLQNQSLQTWISSYWERL